LRKGFGGKELLTKKASCLYFWYREQNARKDEAMRNEMSLQEYLEFGSKSSVKIVKQWQEKYLALDEILRENPEIIRLAHKDFTEWLSESANGRQGKYTTDEIVRSLMVMFLEGDSYRDVVIRIDGSEFLRKFVGMGWSKAMMDFTFLSRALSALQPETLEAINRALARYAKATEKISGDKLRGDTTVYETNIHHPTDSSLLWDCYRVLSRELKGIQREIEDLEIVHRFHPNKARRRAAYIARHAKSKSKKRRREVKTEYRELIAQVRWIARVSGEIRGYLRDGCYEERMLAHYEDLAERVVYQAEKRVFEGIMVPADQKVYSIFEDHTELIKRGKAGKEVEFGHKILLAQTGEKFIAQYEVYERREEDAALVDSMLQEHRSMFDKNPELLTLDRGFYESGQKLTDLRQQIPTVSIRKKGRKTKAEQDLEACEQFKAGQRFRAGIEGTISVLK
jgi:IS5 family transposase